MRFRLAAPVALLLATFAASAPAQTPPSAPASSSSPAQPTAATLKAEGDELFLARRFTEALQKYEQAYAQAPSPALLYNRARSLEALARHPEALEALERFEREATPDLKARVATLDELLGQFRDRVSRLTVRCSVPGARVLVDKREVATTPVAAPLALNAGRSLVEVVADGYFPFARTLDLPGRGQAAVDAELRSRATSGLVVVQSDVAGSAVAVDGQPVGDVPAELALPPGSHVIVVSRSGYRDAEASIVVKSGERRDLSLSPTSQPLTARWYFWAGVGALVVGGGIATYVALTTERSGTTGENFSPNTVYTSLPLRF